MNLGKLDRNRLSAEMLKDLTDYEKTGEDALYCLLKSNDLYSTDEIITRFQSENIGFVAFTGLRTAKEWNGGFYTNPTEIKSSAIPLSNTGRFSSFALKEKDSNLGIIQLPLKDTFASTEWVFENKKMDSYKRILDTIENSYGVKVVSSNDDNAPLYQVIKQSSFKGLLKSIFKTNNANKIDKDKYYSVTISIANELNIGGNLIYTISEQEKIIKVLDTIIEKQIETYDKGNDFKYTNAQKIIARLVADTLMTRAIPMGTGQNIRAEMALNLKLSNTIAYYDLTKWELKEASSLGLNIALDTIKTLNISNEDIKNIVRDGHIVKDNQDDTLINIIVPKTQSIFNNNEIEEEKDIDSMLDDMISNLNIQKVDDTEEATTEEATTEESTTEEVKQEEVKENEEVKQEEVKENEEIKQEEVKENEDQQKIKTKNQFFGVRRGVFVKQKTAENYIDKAITKVITNETEKIVSKRYSREQTSKKIEMLDRKYNFLDHLLSFYNIHNKDNNDEQIDKELGDDRVADNNVAHAYANAFVELRAFIIKEIFGDKKSIEKPEGKDVATLVNDVMEKMYKMRLSTFISSKIKKETKEIFKQIDNETYTKTSFINEI